MSNPVVIDFIIRGMPNVLRAMRTTEQAAAESEKATTKRAEKESKSRVKLAEQEAKEKIAALKKADTAHRQAWNTAEREVEASVKKKKKREESQAKDQVSTWKKADAEVKKLRDKAYKEAEADAKKRAKDDKKAADEKIASWKRADSEIKKARDKAAREVESQLRKEERDRERSNREQNRSAERWVRNRERAANRAANERKRTLGRFADTMGAGFGSGIGRVMDATRGTANLVAQLGGGFDIASSVQRNVKVSASVADLMNVAINPASAVKANHERRDRGTVDSSIDANTARWGYTRGESAEGLHEFTGITGDLETAMRLLPRLSELARATGTDLKTMMGAAANAGMAFDSMTDSGEKAKKIEGIMRTLAGQAKAGNIEVPDLAKHMGRMVAAAGKFEGDNSESIQKIGMIMQAARGGGGAWNAATSAQAVSSFTQTFGKSARLGAFESAGVKVFSDKEQTILRDPVDLIADSLDATKGSIPKLNAMWGSAYTDRSIHKFADAYTKGWTDPKTGKTLKGREAVKGYADNLMKSVTMTQGQISEAANSRTSELDVDVAKSQAAFDKAVREKIIPAITKLAPEIEKLATTWVDLNADAIPTFVDLIRTIASMAKSHKGSIEWMAQHPVAALIGAEITKSFASAALPELLRRLLTNVFGGGGGGAPVPTGGGGGGAVGGALAMAGVAAIATVASNATSAYSAGDDAASSLAQRLQAYQNGDRVNGVSPEVVQKQLDEARGRLNADDAQYGMVAKIGRVVATPFDKSASKEYRQVKHDQGLLDSKELAEQLRKTQEAMRALTTATNANTAATGSSTTQAPATTPGDAARSAPINARK